ncbi:Uu.00g127530.m01.CDS01 [Anthostomella pinea]|uniref:Uu.00g127530.m01.CDS01 n=1 Tax=Anthostomella pinea TaxID=933095 RepID=A0AAI8VI41_9PEZI|nr:Uu.00g127530.m01.CDS01 [Anthostomella pinea]
MDNNRESIISKGMTQVHMGLGILLGAARISSGTHEQIMRLVNADEDLLSFDEPTDFLPAKEVDLGHRTVNLAAQPHLEPAKTKLNSLLDFPFEPMQQYQQPQPQPQHQNQHQQRPQQQPQHQHQHQHQHQQKQQQQPSKPFHASRAQSENQMKIICPWWATPGFKCREQAKGICPWYHEAIPGGHKYPLICAFWANDRRCRKAADKCRFAHYPAQHGKVAPLPPMKKTAVKKERRAPGKALIDDDW